MVLTLGSPASWAQSFTFQSAGGGITLGGTGTNATMGFGNVNGLGIVPTVAAVTPFSGTLSGATGFFYTSRINLNVQGSNGHPAAVDVFVGAPNFQTPIVQAVICITVAGCGSATGYSAVSLNATTPTTVIAQPGVTQPNTIVPVFIGIFVQSQNGASIIASQSAAITFETRDGNNGHLSPPTNTLTLNATGETAVQLTLSAGTLSVTCNGATPKCNGYTASFGRVDALGISSGNGVPPIVLAAGAGAIYCGSYTVNPAFSGFSSKNGTVSAQVTAKFANSSMLALEDSSATSCIGLSSGSFTPIPIAPNTGLTIININNNASGFPTPITRVLGLSVSGGPTSNSLSNPSLPAADSATLTFTMTVP